MAKPQEITFEVTNKCNNFCLHCSTNASPNGKNELSVKQVTDICDYFHPEWANLSGGEPLLAKDIYKMIKNLKKRQIKIRLYTSGNIDSKLIDKALKIGVDKVIFGVESIYPDTHDYITQTIGSFNITMKNIKHTINKGASIQVHLVPMKPNQEQLYKTIESLKQLKVEKVSLLKLVPQGRAKYKNIMPDEKIFETILDLKDKYGDFIRLGSPFDYSIPCEAGVGKLVVTSDYKITPCETFKAGKCNCERANKQGLEMALKLHSFFEQYDPINKNIGIPWAESDGFLVTPDINNKQKHNILSRFRI